MSYVKIIGAVFSVHIEKRFQDPVSVKQSVSLFENVLALFSSGSNMSAYVYLAHTGAAYSAIE